MDTEVPYIYGISVENEYVSPIDMILSGSRVPASITTLWSIGSIPIGKWCACAART